MESIIVAVLGLAGALAGTYFANRKSSALIAYRLEQLEKKVQAHNNLIERTYKLEEQTCLQEERIRALARRMDTQPAHCPLSGEWAGDAGSDCPAKQR